VKALRYVELDYPCHMSSEVLIASANMTKARRMPKWRLTDARMGRTELTAVALNPVHHFSSWIALGGVPFRRIKTLITLCSELQAETKSWLSFHERTPKKCAAPNLQMPLTLASAGKSIGQLPVPQGLSDGRARRSRAQCQPPDTVTWETQLTPFLPLVCG
jgi:hypothetical protein